MMRNDPSKRRLVRLLSLTRGAWLCRLAAGLCLALLPAAGALAAGPGEASEAAPRRVVSINLCTDQLAMLLAAPGQLVSVTELSAQPRSSAMAQEARRYRLNHGMAEEIYLMDPDLVIAGRFTASATVAMLRRLGIPVAVFDPAYSLADVRARLAGVGAALHREARAAELIAGFDTRLAELRERTRGQGDAPADRAALYFANGYTSGEHSLAGDIVAAAGLANIAAERGIASGGHLPLELLALSAPDLLITGSRYPGASRSEEILDHPVLSALRKGGRTARMTDRDWVCGTPYVLRAVETLTGEAAQ